MSKIPQAQDMLSPDYSAKTENITSVGKPKHLIIASSKGCLVASHNNAGSKLQAYNALCRGNGSGWKEHTKQCFSIIKDCSGLLSWRSNSNVTANWLPKAKQQIVRLLI